MHYVQKKSPVELLQRTSLDFDIDVVRQCTPKKYSLLNKTVQFRHAAMQNINISI